MMTICSLMHGLDVYMIKIYKWPSVSIYQYNYMIQRSNYYIWLCENKLKDI